MLITPTAQSYWYLRQHISYTHNVVECVQQIILMDSQESSYRHTMLLFPLQMPVGLLPVLSLPYQLHVLHLPAIRLSRHQ